MGGFQQTVNLKEKMEKDRDSRLQSQFKPSQKVEPEKIVLAKEFLAKKTEAKSRSEAIDKFFDESGANVKMQDTQKIIRPVFKKQNFIFAKYRKYLILLLLIAVAVGGFYFYKHRRQNFQPVDNQPVVVKWYAVKLTSGDVFYGKINDTKADPVVLTNVYYDYDQMNKDAENPDTNVAPKKDTGNLRLVKRGKEAYGPDGTLNIVRAQVIFMEPLADDSKVLKAITENEK
jgi:hypothetical protein